MLTTTNDNVDIPSNNLKTMLQNHMNSTTTIHNVAEITNFLGNFTKSVKKMENALIEEKDPVKRKQKADNLRGTIIQLADLLFDYTKTPLVESSDSEDKNRLVSTIFAPIESSAPLLASLLKPGEVKSVNETNAKMLLINVNLTSTQKKFRFNLASVSVAFDGKSLLALSGDNKTIGIACVLVRGGGQLLSPTKPANELQQTGDTFNGKNARFNTDVLMISVNVTTMGKIMLSSDVNVTLKLLSASLSSPVCYSMQPNSAEVLSAGCTLQSINNTHGVCSCNHLTSFAILMSVTEAAEKSSLALDIVSYVSCSLSILFLLLSFITFVSFAVLKSHRNTIHTNLVVCLALGQLLFLVGIDLVDDKVGGQQTYFKYTHYIYQGAL